MAGVDFLTTIKFVDGPPPETDEMENMDEVALGDNAVEAPDSDPGSEGLDGFADSGALSGNIADSNADCRDATPMTGSHNPGVDTGATNGQTTFIDSSGSAQTIGSGDGSFGSGATSFEMNMHQRLAAQLPNSETPQNTATTQQWLWPNQTPWWAASEDSALGAASQPNYPFPLPGFVADELAKLPGDVFDQLINDGTGWDVTINRIGEYQDFGNSVPRGWEGRQINGQQITTNDLPDVFDPESNTVVLSTDPVIPNGSVDVVLHETGHTYDQDAGLASGSQEFKDAYNADQGTFDPADIRDSYYTFEGNPKGYLSETYAESFANFFSGNSAYEVQHPHLWAYWKAHQ